MSDRQDGGPAWPSGSFDVGNGDSIAHTPGMSLRDWLAGRALTGLLAGYYADTTRHNLGEVPAEAIRIADAMIEMLDACKPAAIPPAATEAGGGE